MRQMFSAWLNGDDAAHRMTLDGLADVDAGRVVSHESLQALAVRIIEGVPAPEPVAEAKPRRGMGRRKRPRLPRRWAEGMEMLPGEPDVPPKRRRKNDSPIVVTDAWPEQVPISDDELRIIEGCMRMELDDLFGPLP